MKFKNDKLNSHRYLPLCSWNKQKWQKIKVQQDHLEKAFYQVQQTYRGSSEHEFSFSTINVAKISMYFLNALMLHLFSYKNDFKNIFVEYEQMLHKNSLLTLSKIKPLLKFKDKKVSKSQRVGLSLRYRFDLVLKKVFNIWK